LSSGRPLAIQDGLFTVPAGYEVKDGALKFKLLEVAKTKKIDVSSKP